MKNYYLIVLCFLLFGCSKDSLKPSGKQVTEIRDASNFTGISIEGANELVISYGTTFKVELKGSDNLLKHYQTNVVSGVLKLGYTRDRISGDDIKIHITLPALTRINSNGASEIKIEGLFPKQSTFIALASGAGKITVKDEFEADEVFVRLEGAVNVDLINIQSLEADVKAEGSGNIWLNVANHLSAKVGGNSKVYYMGDPVVVTDLSGAGAVVKL